MIRLPLAWLSVTALLIAGCWSSAAEPDKLLIAGQQALAQKKVREALGHFRQAASNTPSSAAAQLLRGMTAEALGEFDEALDAYKAGVKIKPSTQNHFRLGALAERMGDTDQAIESLSASLLSGPPGDERVAEYLFRMLIESENLPEALELAKGRQWVGEQTEYCDQEVKGLTEETRALLAMLLRPEHADCLFPVGIALTESGLVRPARMILIDRINNSSDQQVRKKSEVFLRHRLPDHDIAKLAESLNVTGYNLQYTIKDKQAALEVYQKAIAADGAFSWPYHNIAQVHLNAGETSEAMEWYRKATNVNPNHWKAQLNMGNLAFRLNQYDDAVTAFRQAALLKPDDPGGHSGLGRVLLSLGQKAEGIRELQEALRLDPSRQDDKKLLDDTLGRRTS